MRFNILDYSGHSTVEFDKSQINEAMEKFYDLLNQGHIAAHRDEGQRDYSVSRRFVEADETLFVPHLRGG